MERTHLIGWNELGDDSWKFEEVHICHWGTVCGLGCCIVVAYKCKWRSIERLAATFLGIQASLHEQASLKRLKADITSHLRTRGWKSYIQTDFVPTKRADSLTKKEQPSCWQRNEKEKQVHRRVYFPPKTHRQTASWAKITVPDLRKSTNPFTRHRDLSSQQLRLHKQS